jgi:hypothetical protein
MSVILGKASDGRHFIGGGGGGPGITTPGTGFITVGLEDAEVTAVVEDTQITAALQTDEVTAALEDVEITATPQQDPISVTVFPDSIVARTEGGSAEVAPLASQGVSVEFDGAESLAKAGVALGVSEPFSKAVWWRPQSGTSGDFGVCGFGVPAAVVRNKSGLAWVTSGAPSLAEIQVRGPAGPGRKTYRFHDMAIEDFWNLTVWTWDNTNLVVYHAGALVVPDATPNNGIVPALTDVAKTTEVGLFDGRSPFVGLIHSDGLWSSVLTAAEAAALWNEGRGRDLDWRIDGSIYKSSSDLAHYYRLGLDPADIGKDYGNAAILLNIGDDAVGIDASDIVIESP